jgi:hypothetical protein
VKCSTRVHSSVSVSFRNISRRMRDMDNAFIQSKEVSFYKRASWTSSLI